MSKILKQMKLMMLMNRKTTGEFKLKGPLLGILQKKQRKYRVIL
jgi:hypothetical protein